MFVFEREEKGEKKRERNIDVQKTHQLAASLMCLTGDLALNPGMCPDWELNQQPFSSQAGSQSRATPARVLRVFNC